MPATFMDYYALAKKRMDAEMDELITAQRQDIANLTVITMQMRRTALDLLKQAEEIEKRMDEREAKMRKITEEMETVEIIRRHIEGREAAEA